MTEIKNTVRGDISVEFEIGDYQKPRGHAVAYFRVFGEHEKILTTYMVVLPVAVDFTKYVPPFLASQFGNFALKEASAFALPPVPEEVQNYEMVRILAELRKDDLIFGGTLNSADIEQLMQQVSDLVQEYGSLWQDYANSSTFSLAEIDNEDSTLAVNEVMYSLMNERDRLSELSKMVGRLRFALSGEDNNTRREVEEEIRILGTHLPEHFQVERILEVGRDLSSKGEQLAQLYMERCYKISVGETDIVVKLENKIKALEEPG